MKTYEDGLNEAWKYAWKLFKAEKCDKEMNEIFGDDFYYGGAMKILAKYSVSEVIEKLKEYEEIKVGDEVENKEWKGTITWISPDGEFLVVMLEDGTAIRWKKKDFKKTGRHFPQIEEVLKQMKEEENGL